MFKNFLVLVILIGIGFFLGVSQSDALFKTFPTLHHTTASVITTTPATSLVRCADEVQTAGWQTFRSEHLGINFLYPVNFAVTENSDSVDIKDLTATGSAVDHILLERLSGNFESHVDDSMQQGSWKIADRRTYALTTPFYSDEQTGQLTSKYLFIKNFPQHALNGTYIMFRATVQLGPNSQNQFDTARKAGVVDLESSLTTPEQILSTFRFIDFDEGKDQG